VDLPNWMSKKQVKKKSFKKETKCAKDLGGHTQPGSGNMFYAKGDIVLDKFLIEHKYTDNKSYSLTIETFKKIEREAQEKLKLPAMIIEVQNRKFVVLRYEDVK